MSRRASTEEWKENERKERKDTENKIRNDPSNESPKKAE